MIHVLLIEDNPADIYLLREALAAHESCEFTVIGNGDQAFDFVSGNGAGMHSKRPDLVILDLNLPGKDGAQVLGCIRANAELQNVFVAVMSSSPKDVMRKKTAQANCYITKPSELNQFFAIGKELVELCAKHGR